MTATRERKLIRAYFADHISITFPDGSAVNVSPSDFSYAIQTTAMLRGLANRLCQGVETPEDFHANVEQLKSDVWADKSKGPSETTQVIAAYVQLAEEQGKVLSAKAAKEFVASKVSADPSFAVNKMADARFRDAFARSQVATGEKVTSLDDLG